MASSSMATWEVTLRNFRCEDLAAVDRGGTSDPYIKIDFDSGFWTDRSSTKARELNPVWGDDYTRKFVYRTRMAHQLRGKRMKLVVMDSNRWSSHVLIGKASVDLQTLATGPRQQVLFLRDGTRMRGKLMFECVMTAKVNMEVILRDVELSGFNAAALSDAALQVRYASRDEDGKEAHSDWVREASGRHEWEYVNAIVVPTDFCQIERGALEFRLESASRGQLGSVAIGLDNLFNFVDGRRSFFDANFSGAIASGWKLTGHVSFNGTPKFVQMVGGAHVDGVIRGARFAHSKVPARPRCDIEGNPDPSADRGGDAAPPEEAAGAPAPAPAAAPAPAPAAAPAPAPAAAERPSTATHDPVIDRSPQVPSQGALAAAGQQLLSQGLGGGPPATPPAHAGPGAPPHSAAGFGFQQGQAAVQPGGHGRGASFAGYPPHGGMRGPGPAGQPPGGYPGMGGGMPPGRVPPGGMPPGGRAGSMPPSGMGGVLAGALGSTPPAGAGHHHSHSAVPAPGAGHTHTPSWPRSMDPLRRPPKFWEAKRAPDGRVYFVNHILKTTAWDLPTDRQYRVQFNHPGPLGMSLTRNFSFKARYGYGSRRRYSGMDLGAMVEKVIPGSPASRAGSIQAFHHIVSINGHDTTRLNYEQTLRLLDTHYRPLVLDFENPFAVAADVAAAAKQMA